MSAITRGYPQFKFVTCHQMISDDLRFVRWQDPAKIGSHSRSHRNVSSCEARPLLCQDLARASSLRNAHSFGMPGATLIKNTLQLGVDQGPYYPKGKYIYIYRVGGSSDHHNHCLTKDFEEIIPLAELGQTPEWINAAKSANPRSWIQGLFRDSV